MAENQHAEKIVNIGHADNVYLTGNTSVRGRDGSVSLSTDNTTYAQHRRYLLENLDDEYEFELYPNPLYVLSVYFVTLNVAGERYILLDYTSYSPFLRSKGVNNIWSVPFTVTPIDLGGRKVRKVKEIRSAYSQTLEKMTDKLTVLEDGLFFNLGIFYKEFEKGREYIEYKRSVTEPDKMRCNYIREFFVRDVDSTGILNLADPECLQRHYYLPLSHFDSLSQPAGLYCFLDKPMPENVTDVLINDRRKLIRNEITIRHNDLVSQMEGILFVITMTDCKGEFSCDYLAHSVIDQGMMYAGIGRYCIDGSHIIGTMPAGDGNFTDLLGRLYDGLSKLTKKLILHCTALCCRFEYGKTLSISSMRPCFAGDGYEKIRKMDTETVLARVYMRDDSFSGIFFGWDAKDQGRFKFNGKDYTLKKYNADNRTMNFRIMYKGDGRNG